MTFEIGFQNPYPESTVKTLLEDSLLIPRKVRHYLRTTKHIWINGHNINWQTVVKPGDLIKLYFEDSVYPEKKILWGDSHKIDCLYEDEHLIVVNKPEGIKTHGNEPNEIALLNHVCAYTKQTCYVVHRLDMETSGAILFAKNPFILPILNRLLENKTIYREYWAVTERPFDSKTVVYKDKIGRHRHDRRKRIVDQKYGQNAITEVRLLKKGSHVSLINCRLKTGRTHQIRVHLAYHRHAIIGDPLYATEKASRLMLHAHRLSFIHPLSLEKIRVNAISDSF